ncbi:MAG: hypothetical protein ACT4O2_09420 [Beijerinckiaceae bacterium]
MRMAPKILFVTMIVIAPTAVGVAAATPAKRYPSSVADIGLTPKSPLAFIPYDGKELDA